MDTRRTPHPAGSEAGFTLVEVLIAIIVLVFGLIAITNLFLVATSSNINASYSTAATTQATEVMERLKAVPFMQLQVGGDLTTPPSSTCEAGLQDCVVPGNFTSYRTVPGVGRVGVVWTIADPGDGGNTLFITVKSEGESVLFRGRTTAEFTTFRTCTLAPPDCP